MQLDQLQAMAVFARVAETGSFSEAARRLGLSKAAVSKRVARLEARLGVALVNRTTRHLSLTEAGAAFHEPCRQLIADADAAEAAVGHLASAPRGRLRVNAPMSFGQRHLAPAIGAFMRSYPELSVELDLSDRTVDLVEEGYDLAVRIGALPDSSLVARRLAPLHRHLVAAPAYLDRAGRPEHPSDLADHACLRYAYLASGRVWRLDGGEAVTVDGPLTANNGDVLLAAARDGMGIAFLPSFFTGPDLCAGMLERVLPGWTREPAGGIHAVFPPGRARAPKVRAFTDFLAERFGAAWTR